MWLKITTSKCAKRVCYQLAVPRPNKAETAVHDVLNFEPHFLISFVQQQVPLVRRIVA